MPKIVLVRHGRPEVLLKASMSGREFGDWVDSYNAAPLCNRQVPPAMLREVISDCDKFICSTLRRSIMSAQVLGIEHYQVNSLFNEAELPFIDTGLRAPTVVWLVVCRALWFLGYSGRYFGRYSGGNSGSRRVESFHMAKVRANHCTDELIAMAMNSSGVVFVGHGILNKLISRRLLKRGWQGPSKTDNHYWGNSEYSLSE